MHSKKIGNVTLPSVEYFLAFVPAKEYAARMFSLLILNGDGTAQRHELRQGVTTVGRSPENMIVFDNASVSTRHADSIIENGKTLLRDLNSSNGTTVNGAAVTEVALIGGDAIGFGSVVCRVEAVSVIETPPPSPVIAPAPPKEDRHLKPVLPQGANGMKTEVQPPRDQPLSVGAIERAKSIKNAMEVERKVHAVYEASLFPIAERFAFRLGISKNDAIGLPTVLLLGNHSSGKSSFINHIFGLEIQKTGVAPVDDGFTLIMHGDEETDLDGKTIVTHPKLPYKGLEQFGPTFVSHLKLKVRNSDVLRSLVLIDSPGMIDSPTRSRTRGYDFTSVVRHFAESADLIVFFFDPDKPGTTGESLSAFTEALSGVAHKLLIVMNKIDLFPNMRDFARAYGALCWNLAHVIKTKDLPHIFCTYIDTGSKQQALNHAGLPLGDFKESCDEVISEINRAPERRSDNLVSTLYESARRLEVHARVTAAIGKRFWTLQAKTWATTIGITALASLIAWLQKDWGILLVGLALSGVSHFVGTRMLKNFVAATLHGIDEVFYSEFQRELTMQSDKTDLAVLWESVRAGVLEYLKQTDLSRVPLLVFNKPLFQQLSGAITKDIPMLRREIV